MRAKRGRQETDDPLLTPWELGELGAWELVAGACAGCRVQGVVEGVKRWSSLAAAATRSGDMQ